MLPKSLVIVAVLLAFTPSLRSESLPVKVTEGFSYVFNSLSAVSSDGESRLESVKFRLRLTESEAITLASKSGAYARFVRAHEPASDRGKSSGKSADSEYLRNLKHREVERLALEFLSSLPAQKRKEVIDAFESPRPRPKK